MFSRVSISSKVLCKSSVNVARINSGIRHFSAGDFKQKTGAEILKSAVAHNHGIAYETSDKLSGDHLGRQQNHIWKKDEIDKLMNSLYRHKPEKFADKLVNGVMYGMYHTFNFVTGYKPVNPSVNAIQWRLIVLESVAGVPGFVAAGFRHFKSLRRLQRDHGWISTLLEEAENERMHLFVCLKMFNAGFVTRSMVLAAQVVLTPVLMATYFIRPQSMHRFVAYLEETACLTYKNVIEHVEQPGTHLHKGWATVPAPEIAISYWKLPADAMWVDTLKCMFADETHHRDVNHAYAEMNQEDPNPFVGEHRANAIRALQMEQTGETAWPSANTSAEVKTKK